jgi:hypothetical protein
MKKSIAIMAALLCFAVAAKAQESITAHGSTVLYARPDASNWNLVKNELDPKSNIYLLMFERNPIEDAEGRRIKPVIALICEPVNDSSNVIDYSIRKRAQVPFTVKQMLVYQKGHFTYPNSVGYEGEYERGVLHKVFVGHLRHKEVGVQIICDSTDGVYGRVETDMRDFLRSVTFKK